MSIPELWTTIDVDKDISPSSVLRFIRNAGALPLKMCIVLDSEDPILSLDYLAPFVHQLASLKIESDRAETLCRLRQTFWALSAPNARFFSVSLKRNPSPSTNRAFAPPLLVTQPWFPGPATALETMHLGVCSALPFWNTDFPALCRLCVWGFSFRHTVSIDMVKTVVESSPLLRVVTLRRFSCIDSFDSPSVISSSSVEEMGISWGYDDSMVLLISTFVFPSLTKFSIDLCCWAHVRDMLRIPRPLLSAITTLIVLNPRDPRRHTLVMAAPMFEMFPSLTFLDISGSRPPLFLEFLEAASIFAASHSGLNLIPALQTLLLSTVDACNVIQVAKLYGARAGGDGTDLVLRTVRASRCLCPHNDTEAISSERSWLTAHLTDFTSTVDPRPCPAPEACAWSAKHPELFECTVDNAIFMAYYNGFLIRWTVRPLSARYYWRLPRLRDTVKKHPEPETVESGCSNPRISHPNGSAWRKVRSTGLDHLFGAEAKKETVETAQGSCSFE
ncbi:hypothetical protein DFH06DRAFT_1150755 [Mycena polygramma]|nr:hypothetical protein DFH06DRAFT_1150755 [Mycena polygramma]